MALYDELKIEIESVISAVKAAADDKKITLQEVAFLAMKVFELVAGIAAKVPADKAAKKALLLQVADDFYSAIIAPLDIPGVPEWLENRFVDPKVGEIWHEIAGGLIDYVLGKQGE